MTSKHVGICVVSCLLWVSAMAPVASQEGAHHGGLLGALGWGERRPPQRTRRGRMQAAQQVLPQEPKTHLRARLKVGEQTPLAGMFSL